ncbi:MULTISPECIES: DUF881 domain-containing protein [unclassified Cellulomonas]|uniref:DUF881 domain-containing protein n=1 Tax=unclassified Cellulomonas TaxID=2620175 RepID=UPI0019AA158C|nr:DUF881 domain-containing protein [Cellulomonas sp. ES6]MBD3780348.1 DUF881 domain-containing protein [Micrococcales bacterium]WHP17900.1 DUF881 domain-containing protein [Cellulomonas sp. ES6]
MSTPDATPAARPATPVVGWRALARALRPRATPAQALTGVLCVMLGFAIAVQVRQTNTASLSTMRETELVSLLDQTTRQADELQDQVSELERTQQELRSGSTSREAALDAATRSAAAQGILSGRLPAEGPGVTVTVRDPEAQVSALTLLNLLEELRNAGAEAVQLNDQRLTASSYVLGTDAGIEVDGTLLSPPYRWVAIGDPDTIATALAIPGGALAKVQIDGGQASVQTQDLVQVTATRTVPEPQHATPRSPEQG